MTAVSQDIGRVGVQRGPLTVLVATPSLMARGARVNAACASHLGSSREQCIASRSTLQATAMLRAFTEVTKVIAVCEGIGIAGVLLGSQTAQVGTLISVVRGARMNVVDSGGAGVDFLHLHRTLRRS